MSDNDSASADRATTERNRISRRRLIQAAGAAGAAVAAGGLSAVPAEAEPADAAVADAAQGGKSGSSSAQNRHRTGTIKDLKHIVILMQENRSFDHYFGTLDLAGARGFGDKQVLTWQNGQTIYYDPNSRAEGYLLPYHADSLKYNAQNTSARNRYFKEADVPWHHAIAKAYTIGDHYFCSLDTSTSPNRIMMWAGTNDAAGTQGGPVVNNNGDYGYAYKFKTYPETLQDAGVSWQIYVNNDTDDNFLGDYTDNTVRSFAAFDPKNATPENTHPRKGLLARGGVVHAHTAQPAGIKNDTSNLDYVLRDFISDCETGNLPEVSWVVAPAAWTEHPTYAPNNGAVYTDRVIQAVHDNPELWESTLIILNYDEPDHANRIGEGGFFDHVVPPIPETGTAGERAPGIKPGMGGRVPFVLVSPWTRGGFVNSEVFDHTSTIQLIEEWTKSLGKPAICQNINDWRRSVSGNLLSAIDFGNFDTSFPKLPKPADLLKSVVVDAGLPAVPQPAVGAQVMPTQPITGKAKRSPLSFQPNGVLVENHSTGTATATFTVEGGPSGKAVNLVGLADKYVPALVGAEPLGIGQDALPLTAGNHRSKSYTWDTKATNGKYAFTFYGPDHFIRSFAGTVVPASDRTSAQPRVDVRLVKGSTRSDGRGKSADATVEFTLSADGRRSVTYTLTANDFAGKKTTIQVPAGKHSVVTWPTEDGYYDVIITAKESADFMQRFAGRAAEK
ncbi:alkaline phosphatase family protein [Amycolatopsis sp. NPDC047767]|uniref:alkaline phosphatase family protein n=1 Tax=Amycolatopsis sp. NPDC047767 TaxID=3156765 RepID=UPI0034541FD0